jgi:putative heme transporter
VAAVLTTHPARPSSRRWSDRVRAAGLVAWSLVGVALLVVAGAFLIVLTRPIMLALVVALFVATTFMPVVDGLARRHVPRAIGAIAALLIVIVMGAGATVLVVWGVASQQKQISQNLTAAVDKLHGAVASAGVHGNAAEAVRQSVHHVASTFLSGLLPALGNLLGTGISVLLGLFVALFVCFFLLKDGRAIAGRAAGWIPLPGRLGHSLLGHAAIAIRRYVLGLTVLGAFNAVLVAVGALVLRVPLVATIAVITFLGTYVPYVGAVVSGTFAVLIALGAGGQSTAIWMLLIVVLANTVLQNLVSPFAYGAALQISPLVVLLATLLGGALAGVVGLALATPVTAIVARSIELLTKSRRVADTSDVPAPTGQASDGHPARPGPE